MADKKSDIPIQKGLMFHRARLTDYAVGFVLSLGLTVLAYALVQLQLHNASFSRTHLLLMLAGLAVTQLMVQLLFFLHLGEESKPRWNLMMFGFAAMVISIVVVGSLWIMHNLDYNMNQHMTNQQVNNYLNSQDSL